MFSLPALLLLFLLACDVLLSHCFKIQRHPLIDAFSPAAIQRRPLTRLSIFPGQNRGLGGLPPDDSRAGATGQLLDLRRRRFSVLLDKLVDAQKDARAIQRILDDNKAFLLEPFVSPEGVEGASIFRAGQSLSERLDVYKVTMGERIDSATSVSSHVVMRLMRDAVVRWVEEMIDEQEGAATAAR
ncbi:unnamed protein product [Vitrella brassicaformis CCMP3155]|uniref:Uncharacterized protein n=1 Tax=Vitrella brassicaformis (strain CCMP3155) TaxID=1169540 RepID=A0A0G4GS05_VITBC|nr:unnamed protein product [Vitrella brassicaformis CCMP3155]|eukprot:CEM33394.1 unnamed protein product [Vitrella brassicaformis CCMP3155]